MRKFIVCARKTAVFCLILWAVFCLCIKIRGRYIEIPQYQSSYTLYSREGIPLRAELVNKEDYRMFCALDDISEYLKKAVICAEDKRFYRHFGVDWRALIRAVWQNSIKMRIVSGGSTVTSQLIKIIYSRPRNLTGKLQEFFDACALESRMTKDQILEQYLNRVFWGHQNTGIQAASLYYFSKLPRYLSLQESAMLAVMLRAPSRYDPARNYNLVYEKSCVLIQNMLNQEMITEHEYAQSMAAVPVISTLYSNDITHYPSDMSSKTAISYYFQKKMQNLLDSSLELYGVNNGVILVYDIAEKNYLAYCGNSSLNSFGLEREYNAAKVFRHPGSLLKPFLYYSFFKRKSPASIIEDSPVQFEGKYAYIPKNFDNQYYGPVSCRVALACSRNIPAVKILDEYGSDQFMQELRDVGFKSLNKNADYYGLSVVLGGCEVSAEELVSAYSFLASNGSSPEGYMTADVLSDVNARKNAFGTYEPALKMAVKTGTSEGFYDSWAVAYNPHIVMLVWCGNLSRYAPVSKNGDNYALKILLEGITQFKKDSISQLRSGWFEKPPAIKEGNFCSSCGGRKNSGVIDFYSADVHECICGNNIAELKILWPASESRFIKDPSIPDKYQKIRVLCSQSVQWHINGNDTDCEGLYYDLPVQKGVFYITAVQGKSTAEIRVNIF